MQKKQFIKFIYFIIYDKKILSELKNERKLFKSKPGKVGKKTQDQD